MFRRTIVSELKEWRNKKNRKPLVLRGARQVGKTTAVNLFAEDFEQYIYLNLELQEDHNIFETATSVSEVVEAVYFLKNKKVGKQTLLFIDEIQNSPKAVAMLRYFYEEMPKLYVIAAGSLLETLLDLNVSFPVGRVEFLVMHPVSFEEFLVATGEESALKMLSAIPTPLFAEEKMYTLFHQYAQVGGMPEAVREYSESKDLTLLAGIYDNLNTSYIEDVEKYAPSDKALPVIRHVMSTAFYEMSGRIKYAGFGNSNYGSKEIKEALLLLEKAFLFQLVHPVTQTTLPIMPNLKKSPRLHILDTALSVYALNMEKELFLSDDMNSVFSGRVIEHLVGQEFFSLGLSPNNKLNFWVREKTQSNAEVDYIIQFQGRVIPIEVKSGSSGRLRSLHQFMDNVSHDVAVRFGKCSFNVEEAKTASGKPYRLINAPYYMASKIYKILEEFAS